MGRWDQGRRAGVGVGQMHYRWAGAANMGAVPGNNGLDRRGLAGGDLEKGVAVAAAWCVCGLLCVMYMRQTLSPYVYWPEGMLRSH